LKAKWPWYKRKAKRKASLFSAFFLPKYPLLHFLSLSLSLSLTLIWDPNNKNWLLPEGEWYNGESLLSKAKLGKTT
jgi:hypothetical protein